MNDDTWKLKLRILRQKIQDIRIPDYDGGADLEDRWYWSGNHWAIDAVEAEIDDMLGPEDE